MAAALQEIGSIDTGRTNAYQDLVAGRRAGRGNVGNFENLSASGGAHAQRFHARFRRERRAMARRSIRWPTAKKVGSREFTNLRFVMANNPILPSCRRFWEFW